MAMQRRIRRFRLTTSDGKTIFEEEIDVASIPTSEIDSIMDILKTISNESRFKVIRWIAEKRSSSFKELCTGLGYSQKTIAQSLDDLLRINAIARTPEGYTPSPLYANLKGFHPILAQAGMSEMLTHHLVGCLSYTLRS